MVRPLARRMKTWARTGGSRDGFRRNRTSVQSALRSTHPRYASTLRPADAILHAMAAEQPVFERSLHIRQIDYTITVRARPATIRRTVLRLLPWALFIALPEGRMSRVALAAARRVSPLSRHNVR